jgi:hypothetical protein
MVHLNIKERLASGELMHNKWGKLVSTAKHNRGKKLYSKYRGVMEANRASPFSSPSKGGRTQRRRR